MGEGMRHAWISSDLTAMREHFSSGSWTHRTRYVVAAKEVGMGRKHGVVVVGEVESWWMRQHARRRRKGGEALACKSGIYGLPECLSNPLL